MSEPKPTSAQVVSFSAAAASKRQRLNPELSAAAQNKRILNAPRVVKEPTRPGDMTFDQFWAHYT